LQLKIVSIVANVYFLLQMTIFHPLKYKANVCTPMHWGLSKNTKCVIGNLTILRYPNVTNFEKLYFFSYFGLLFNFSEKNCLNSISCGAYVVLSVNALQNKLNLTYDHCFAKDMYEFKYICNLWIFQKLLLTLYKRIENEDIVIEQTQLIEKFKWFLCLLNLIICVLHAYMIYHLLE